MDMTRIILSLTLVAILGVACFATINSRPVASALAQSEGFAMDNSTKNVPDSNSVAMVGP
jgi:hypothetical protein